MGKIPAVNTTDQALKSVFPLAQEVECEKTESSSDCIWVHLHQLLSEVLEAIQYKLFYSPPLKGGK